MQDPGGIERYPRLDSSWVQPFMTHLDFCSHFILILKDFLMFQSTRLYISEDIFLNLAFSLFYSDWIFFGLSSSLPEGY